MTEITERLCIVPTCNNTSTNTPNKLFINVPNNSKRRKDWFDAAGHIVAIHGKITTEHCYCCEDHFDLENDIPNYMQYKLMGGDVRLKQHVVPNKLINQFNKEHDVELVGGIKRRLDVLLSATPGESAEGETLPKKPAFSDVSNVQLLDEVLQNAAEFVGIPSVPEEPLFLHDTVSEEPHFLGNQFLNVRSDLIAENLGPPPLLPIAQAQDMIQSAQLLDRYCRICLKNQGMHKIFEVKHEGLFLWQHIERIGHLQITKDEGSPCSICVDCFDQVILADTLRRRINASEAKLRNAVLINVVAPFPEEEDEQQKMAEEKYLAEDNNSYDVEGNVMTSSPCNKSKQQDTDTSKKHAPSILNHPRTHENQNSNNSRNNTNSLNNGIYLGCNSTNDEQSDKLEMIRNENPKMKKQKRKESYAQRENPECHYEKSEPPDDDDEDSCTIISESEDDDVIHIENDPIPIIDISSESDSADSASSSSDSSSESDTSGKED